jgi:hypothetical protein
MERMGLIVGLRFDKRVVLHQVNPQMCLPIVVLCTAPYGHPEQQLVLGILDWHKELKAQMLEEH